MDIGICLALRLVTDVVTRCQPKSLTTCLKRKQSTGVTRTFVLKMSGGRPLTTCNHVVAESLDLTCKSLIVSIVSHACNFDAIRLQNWYWHTLFAVCSAPRLLNIVRTSKQHTNFQQTNLAILDNNFHLRNAYLSPPLDICVVTSFVELLPDPPKREWINLQMRVKWCQLSSWV